MTKLTYWELITSPFTLWRLKRRLSKLERDIKEIDIEKDKLIEKLETKRRERMERCFE